MSTELYDIPLKTIDGKDTTLAEYKNGVLLIVNVASACGLTPQYGGLEKIYETYIDKGFNVLGFPCNDFGAQEPGTEAEITKFCETRFNVQFPMFSKIKVKGAEQHPLYKALIAAQPKAIQPNGAVEGNGDISWNFEKFLVGRDGKVIARFAPSVTPEAPQIITAIETALGAPA
jgi:glutathione peroxidase